MVLKIFPCEFKGGNLELIDIEMGESIYGLDYWRVNYNMGAVEGLDINIKLVYNDIQSWTPDINRFKEVEFKPRNVEA